MKRRWVGIEDWVGAIERGEAGQMVDFSAAAGAI